MNSNQNLNQTTVPYESLNRMIEDLGLHQEILNRMKLPFIIMGYVARKMGAIGYKGGIGTAWVSFLMPDFKIKFGVVGLKDDDYAFIEENDGSKWRAFFKVEEFGKIENFNTAYINN